jgi:uncharacterized membrane protein YgcG
LIATTVAFAVAGADTPELLAFTFAVSLVGSSIFGVFAALAPRGAVVVFVVLVSLSAIFSIVAFLREHDRGVPVQIVLDAAAIICAVRAFPFAVSYREDRRRQTERERDYERQERWRAGSGWYAQICGGLRGSSHHSFRSGWIRSGGVLWSGCRSWRSGGSRSWRRRDGQHD